MKMRKKPREHLGIREQVLVWRLWADRLLWMSWANKIHFWASCTLSALLNILSPRSTNSLFNQTLIRASKESPVRIMDYFQPENWARESDHSVVFISWQKHFRRDKLKLCTLIPVAIWHSFYLIRKENMICMQSRQVWLTNISHTLVMTLLIAQ